jgi:XTP/dITP diphosphohydrolase
LLLATRNAGKLAEYRRLLARSPVDLVSAAEAGVGDMNVNEDGVTFLANAQKKAREYAAVSGRPALADDSGITGTALGGRPGVQSARFGGEGLAAAERNAKLLEAMEGRADRTAAYVCVIALARPGGPAGKVFLGRCEGRIAREPRGEGGFGYDPVFLLRDGRSMAELGDEEKDAISHRGRAVAELLGQLDLAKWAAE